MKSNRKLGDAELEIMQAIWSANAAQTSVQVRAELQKSRNWALSSIMTSLARLVEKGFLSCEKSTGINLYTALVSEDDYRSQESRSFLEKLYGNSMPELVTTLYGSHVIGKEDIAELRALLDELEGEES